MKLSEKKCVPCTGEVPALAPEQIARLNSQLAGWQVIDNKRIIKSFALKDFKAAMQLADKIAVIADEEGHHPDLTVRFGSLQVELWTHKINALTESDFILADKIDEAAK
jgi:4a-hydroxytetrahydrobiopterin dehydratase